MSHQLSQTHDVVSPDVSRRRANASVVGEAVKKHPWLMAWLSVLPFVALPAGSFAESDTFWQIRTGLITIADRSIPTNDPFSWTAHGEPWTQNSWGFNVLVAAMYRLGDMPAVALASMAFSAGTLALALILARRAGAHPFVAAVLLQALCCVLVIYLQARPQMADYAAVLALVLLAQRIVTVPGRPWAALGAIAAIVVVWVNLHAAAPFGVAILGAAAALATMVGPTRARARWLLAATAVTAVAALVNPYGVAVYEQTFRVRDASTEFIAEWQRLDLTSPLEMFLFVPGVLALGIAVHRRDVVSTAALAVSTIGSVSAMRILPLLALTAFPVLASAATTPAVLRYITSRRTMLTRGSIALIAAVSVLGVVAQTHAGRPDPALYSPEAVEAIPSDCRLLNSYAYGGYIILMRPDVQVSIDSRNDLYGVQRVRHHIKTMRTHPGSDLDGIDCALMPEWEPLAHWLHKDAGWRVALTTESATLFIRTS